MKYPSTLLLLRSEIFNIFNIFNITSAHFNIQVIQIFKICQDSPASWRRWRRSPWHWHLPQYIHQKNKGLETVKNRTVLFGPNVPAAITPEPKPITPAVAPSTFYRRRDKSLERSWKMWCFSWLDPFRQWLAAASMPVRTALAARLQCRIKNASRFGFDKIWHPCIKCFCAKEGLQCRQCSEKPVQISKETHQKTSVSPWTFASYFMQRWQRS